MIGINELILNEPTMCKIVQEWLEREMKNCGVCVNAVRQTQSSPVEYKVRMMEKKPEPALDAPPATG
jgi:hypothetical protein